MNKRPTAPTKNVNLYYLASFFFFVAFLIGAANGNFVNVMAFLPVAIVFAALGTTQK
ncbi:MAG TPA: hypothetical protein VK983_04145 [Candidatus Limnocylindrales bacterium]|nr:hypothetical protein [Candidatus Limnocylindrales bacterium]